MNQDNSYHNILVALDFHNDYQPVLDKAVSIAKRHHAKLTVVHVDINLHNLYTEMVDMNVHQVQEKVLKDTKDKMEHILSGVDYPLKHLVVDGDLVEEITHIIDAQHIDLLVCGHHHTFMKLLTSAARQLMNSVKSDMLVVHLTDD